MGLGVESCSPNIGVKYSAPLRIESRAWVVDHLRALAAKIEENPSTILSIGLVTTNGYGIPTLEVIQADSSIDYPSKST